MTAYTVTLTVELDLPIDDATARDLAARWAAALRLDPRLTSVDGTRLTVRGTRSVGSDVTEFPEVVARSLEMVLARHAGVRVVTWHAVEVVSAAEHAHRDAAASLSEVLSRSATSSGPTP